MATPIPDNLDVRFCPAVPVADLKPIIPRNVVDGNRLTFGRIEDSMRQVGVVEPFVVRNEARGLMIEVGNHRYVLAKKLGITHVPCIVNTVLRVDPKLAGGPFGAEAFSGSIPEGIRFATVEEVLGKVTHVPQYVSIAEWGLNLHFYNFTVEQSVPRGWASLMGRADCRAATFGSSGQHLILTLEPQGKGFSRGVWSEWMALESPAIVMVRSGALHLLRGSPGASATQAEIREGWFERLSAGERFSLRAYASRNSPQVNEVVVIGGGHACQA